MRHAASAQRTHPVGSHRLNPIGDKRGRPAQNSGPKRDHPVDVVVLRFLIQCKNEDVALVQCPPYAPEWIVRERYQRTAEVP
jgi:hypothetical protein